MSEKNNSNTAIAATVAASGAPPAVVNRLLEILEAQERDRQAEIDLKKRQEAEAKARALSVREQNLRETKRKELELQIKQQACRHRVGAAGNFQTALAGWTLVSGRYHFVCQECGRNFTTKEDIDEVNRQGLMPAAENVAAAPRA